MGLSVESQMPLDIMLNPILADEPPLGNKMESIFMKSDQIKNVESMNVDEKEIMESINKQTAPLNNANDEEASAILHDSDLIPTGNNQPAAFSIADPTPTTSTTTTPISTLESWVPFIFPKFANYIL